MVTPCGHNGELQKQHFPRKKGELANTKRVNNLYLPIYVPLKLGGWYRKVYMDQLHFIL